MCSLFTQIPRVTTRVLLCYSKNMWGFYLLIFEIFLFTWLLSFFLQLWTSSVYCSVFCNRNAQPSVIKMMKAGAQVLMSEMVWKCFCFFLCFFFLCFWKMKISFNYFHLSAEKNTTKNSKVKRKSKLRQKAWVAVSPGNKRSCVNFLHTYNVSSSYIFHIFG